MKKILIYGIGNPYRCDDAVGIRVAERLAVQIKQSNIDVKWGSIDGVGILDEIMGYDRVIFVDSVRTEKGTPGTIHKIDPNSFRSSHSFSSHGIDFITALQFGKKLDLKMPEKTDIYAVEIEDNTSYGEACTPKVAAKIPELVRVIMEEIKAIEEEK